MQRYQLSIKKLSIPVKLGNTVEEQLITQNIILDITLHYLATPVPTVCLSDKLSDTVCYAQLSEVIQKYCADKSFKLLETLTYQIFILIKEILPKDCQLALHISKNPPLANLETATFSISDNINI